MNQLMLRSAKLGRHVFLGAAAAGLFTALVAVMIGHSAAQETNRPQAISDAELVEQGRYLATAGDCISCHTRPDGEPFSGGLPFKTPFGTIFSANITPDPKTGIGDWSEQQLARAIREGIAVGGKHLYPALPYTAYTKVSDDHVHAIYAYLRSLKPVEYTPPANKMPFPFGIRALLMGWNILFFKEGRYIPDAQQSPEWNRGAYLTQGLGHCGACHTPRNFMGGERTSLSLTGGVYLDDVLDEVVDEKITPIDEQLVRPWSAVNLTTASNGLGAWSVDEIAAYLKTGHNAHAGAFGPMGVVVANSTSHLSDQDNHAIAVYLKSLPPMTQGSVPSAPAERIKTGEIAFTVRCADCHLPTGLGVPATENADATKTAPPLVGSAVVQTTDPATLINVILYGAHESGFTKSLWPKMSGFDLSVGLDDDQIAALATYVRSSWGNKAGPVMESDVAKQR